MTLHDLERTLEQEDFPRDAHSFNGGLPNESLCIEERSGKWFVYYSERGQRTAEKIFPSEDLACDYFYRTLKAWFV